MTCQELRLYLEDQLGMDANFSAEAEHLAHCAECARLVEERRELRASLRLIRESVPQPSMALNSRVLANYHRQIAAGPLAAAHSIFKRPAAVVISCSAAVATLALATALLLHLPRRPENSTAKIAHPSLSRPDTPMNAANHVSPVTPDQSIKTTRSHVARRRRSVLPVVETPGTVADDFRSLMYCDRLSCGGDMLLIRVQLPSAAPFGPASPAADQIVYADVLVGPDGVARGIRVGR